MYAITILFVTFKVVPLDETANLPEILLIPSHLLPYGLYKYPSVLIGELLISLVIK